MIHGSKYNLHSPLVCEGIIGDGCGGGRVFFIEDGALIAYDPQTKKDILLLKNIQMPVSISKSGCIIFIECKAKDIKFDLSSLARVEDNG